MVSLCCGGFAVVVTPPPDQRSHPPRPQPHTPNPHRNAGGESEYEERGGARSGARTASHRWAPMDSDARGEGNVRRVEEGGNRYQTINADHHNIGGSTAVLLVEHRSYG